MEPPETNSRQLRLDDAGRRISRLMRRFGFGCLRVSLAVIFIWFGALKLIDLSPAAELVRQTVYWMPSDIFLPVLGWWEIAIGVGFLFRPLIPAALVLLFLHVPGTMLPLVLLPEISFTDFPLGLTLEGQYIIKNLVLISGALVIGGTLYGRDAKKQKSLPQAERAAEEHRGGSSPDRAGDRRVKVRDPGRVAPPLTGF